MRTKWGVGERENMMFSGLMSAWTMGMGRVWRWERAEEREESRCVHSRRVRVEMLVGEVM